MTAAQMREARAKLVADARAIQDKADKDTRQLTAEELASQKAMLTEAADLRTRIVQTEDLEAEERETGAPESQRTKKKKSDTPEQEARDAYNAALRSYLCNGYSMLTGDEQRALRAGYIPFEGENRAQNTLSGAAGGFSVAPDTSFYGRVIEALKFFGGMEAVGSTVLTTSTGADLPIATDDDTANVGAIVAEEGSHTGGTNVSLAQKVLHAYLYSSKIIKVSWQLLQDSSFDFESYLGRKLGMRLGRIQNTHFTTGIGTGQPQGLTVGASVGRQSATGNSTSVPADDFIRLKHSVDIAYRNTNAKFMTSDATLLTVMLLKDGNGNYLVQPDFKQAGGNVIQGVSVTINNDMPAMAASAKHTSFGDHSAYYIRRVSGLQIVRLGELYAENGQVGFLGFMRADGGLIDAGQGPVKLLQNSAA